MKLVDTSIRETVRPIRETLKYLPRQIWRAFLGWLQPAPRRIAQPRTVLSPDALPALEPPAALMERLRALPRQVVLCRDIDRRWGELLDAEGAVPSQDLPPGQELLSSEQVALRRHVDACDRCSTVVAALETAVRLPRLELPASLVFRLPALARQRSRPRSNLPRSLREPRWALAASLLMALALQLWIGDPQAFAEGSRARLESSVRGAVSQTRGRAEAWWNQVVHQVEPVLASGRSELDGYGELFLQQAEDLSSSVDALRCRAAVTGWTSPETWMQDERWRPSWWFPATSREEATSPREMTTDLTRNED